MSPGVWQQRGWLSAGEYQGQPVIVEYETPHRYRVRAVGEEIRLPMRNNGVRIVLRSGTVLVPKRMVQFDPKMVRA